MKDENPEGVRIHDHRLRLKQRFEIVRKLGQGACGKVQLGLNKKTAQLVAIKIIKKCKIEKEEDLVRIRREVQIMSSVKHPNIVHIYEVFENSEKIILVMEYCPGGELYDYLSERKRLEEDEARRIFRQIATAIYYCHKHKICHRDLKLENVLLDENGNAKIADFGLSNVFEEKRLLSTFCGSPLYASPEIVKGVPYIGPEVDCWSLGVLLYTLVYGAMPFVGSNFKRLVTQISTGDYFKPKKPSPASDLIRDMLTVDPALRADIVYICNDPWVNKDSDVSCMELAEALANETPVRLDLLLSLAPPPVNDKLVITDEASNMGSDGSPARSVSLANIDTSAERRILEMVAEGGTDAIKPSPTRTIVSANEQPKRKLETTLSMDNAPSQRKKERNYSKANMVNDDEDEGAVAPCKDDSTEMIRDITMDISKMNDEDPVSPIVELPQEKEESLPLKEIPVESNEEVVIEEIPKVVKKEPRKESKVLKEKNVLSKPSTTTKKKIVPKSDDTKVKSSKDKSPSNKNIENDQASSKLPEKKAAQPEETKTAIKVPTERRKSKIMDTAEKLNNLSIQTPQTPTESLPSPPTTKPKRVVIPGVSVGSFKEQFERRASLTSGVPQNETRKLNKTLSLTNQSNNKTLADKKVHSVDSEHMPLKINNNASKESSNITLENIGVEPTIQNKEEPAKSSSEPKKLVVTEISRSIKPVAKSESLKEQPKEEVLSLDEARRSLQQSMDLLNRAKNDSNKSVNEDPNDRQKQLKTAREIISNAIIEDNSGKPPVPYGIGGRSASGSISLSSLGSLPSSPPVSPPHIKPRESPVKTYRTEIQHRVDDVRNKFPSNPSSRGGSVERIIPIQFSTADDNLRKPQPQLNNTSSNASITTQQLPYQRNNTMPYRLSSVPRGSSVETETEKSTAPSTPSRCEPIKKSPREFIIPIAVEGVGYVTPRQGSLEPSETPTKMSNIGFSSFPKPRRISSLVSGGESDEEDDIHMHRLRSTKRNRIDTEKETVSSGEEDDDEGFELLTAENLFSTLLDRVRNLTNRLNGEEGPGFQSAHHQSLFNNLHSPFFNRRHLPEKHKRQNVIIHTILTERASSQTAREGPSWRRSTSRDIASEFDSMFNTPSLFPGVFNNHPPGSNGAITKQVRRKTSSTKNKADTENTTTNNRQSLDLSDLDLSKMELSEREMATLSGLTPALSRRLQNQLLAHLPPAAARSLRRTLSANSAPDNGDKSPPLYTRSLSVGKTRGKSPLRENLLETHFETSPNSVDPDDDQDCSVSTSCNSTSRLTSRDDYNNRSSSSINSVTPRYASTPDRSVLSKYFSPERSPSLLSEPSYVAAYGSLSGIPKRRSLKTPPAETPRRRVSRFLRPDFFDTPREESVYVRDKTDKELETQKVLQEIRMKKNRSSRGHSPCSPSRSLDVTTLFDKYDSKNFLSDKRQSYYPILNEVNEKSVNAFDHKESTNIINECNGNYKSYEVKKSDVVDKSISKLNNNYSSSSLQSKLQTKTLITEKSNGQSKLPTINKNKPEDKDDNGNVTVSFNVNLPLRKQSKDAEVPIEQKEESGKKKTSPEKQNKQAECPTEEKKKTVKKKIVTKKKSTADLEASKDSTKNMKSKNCDEENKTVPVKKKSVLQSIGQKFEKFRSESFTKEKVDVPEKTSTESKPSRIANVMRALRESSVPVGNECGSANESNLIKRAVTITDVPDAVNAKDTNNKGGVQRVLGLFKKSTPKEKGVECEASSKVKRPTSLMLNGSNTRQYTGATSDSVLTDDDQKTNKRGLRLDFSRLPKFNQNIFNRRNSVERHKSPAEDNSESLEEILKRNAELSSECLTSDSTSSMCHPLRHHENTSPDPENIEERIRRKSFYSRFNEKKVRRKSHIVGPGAKEYIVPTSRTHQKEPEPFYFNEAAERPRYDRTISLFAEGKSNPVRYGRTLSLLSPGSYATYSPRTHTRNSAILLRDCDAVPTPDYTRTSLRSKKIPMPSTAAADLTDTNLRSYSCGVHRTSSKSNDDSI